MYFTLRNVKNQCFLSYPVTFHPLDTLLFNLLFIFKKCTQWPFTKISLFSFFSTFLILINIFSHIRPSLNRPYHLRKIISAFLHKWRHPYWNRPFWCFLHRKRENSIKMYIYGIFIDIFIFFYRASAGTTLILLYYKRAAEDELRRMSCGGCLVNIYRDPPEVLD